MAVNVISAGARAAVDYSTIKGKTLAVHAGNESSILSIAGGVSVSTGNNAAAAIGAAGAGSGATQAPPANPAANSSAARLAKRICAAVASFAATLARMRSSPFV